MRVRCKPCLNDSDIKFQRLTRQEMVVETILIDSSPISATVAGTGLPCLLKLSCVQIKNENNIRDNLYLST